MRSLWNAIDPRARAMGDDLPVFPDIPFSSIKKSQFRDIDGARITDEGTFKEFLDLLEREPHVDIYLFSRKGTGMNAFVLGAIRAGIIQSGPTEMNWYPHPKFENDYVWIELDPYWEWEREVLKTAPMYMRTKVFLSDRERRLRELRQVLKPPELLSFKPGLWGMSLDLKVLWRRVWDRLRSRRRKSKL
jgi:hypothetical protein